MGDVSLSVNVVVPISRMLWGALGTENILLSVVISDVFSLRNLFSYNLAFLGQSSVLYLCSTSSSSLWICEPLNTSHSYPGTGSKNQARHFQPRSGCCCCSNLPNWTWHCCLNRHAWIPTYFARVAIIRVDRWAFTRKHSCIHPSGSLE